MGGIRRIKRSLSVPQIAMADAHMTVNGCQVFLGHPDPVKATASAKGFRKMLNITIARARCFNLTDMYNVSLEMREKIESGGSILN